MKTWLVSAILAFSIRSASSQLTTWDNQLFDFGWAPYNPTITRCSLIQVGWNDRNTANPASSPPYTIEAFCSGYQPVIIATVQLKGYNWTVGLPTGGPYILSMKDANGYTGGTSLVFNINDPAVGVTCPSGTYNRNSLQLSSTGTIAECSAIVVTAQGGTAPYTMQVIAGERPPKTTTWTTSVMSYTIDLQPTEQFFIVVTDANGLSGTDGIHTVTTGDTGCYNLASTVRVGAIPTTLSYDPSSTVSFPQGGSSSTSSLSIIQNTATTTIISIVTANDGTKSTLTLPPGASATIASNNGTTTQPGQEANTTIPAIVGGSVGGAALLIILLIIFLYHRRKSAQLAEARAREMYERRKLDEESKGIPFNATHIIPFTQPPPTPGRDTAPLMSHMGSSYSGGTNTASIYTPVPSTVVGVPYFGQHNNASPPGSHVGMENAPAWAMPMGVSHPSSPPAGAYNAPSLSSYSGTSPPPTASSPSSGGGAGTGMSGNPNVPGGPGSWSGQGIPPGAMAPRIGVAVGPDGRPIEKATFVPARAPTAAPPPYMQGT